MACPKYANCLRANLAALPARGLALGSRLAVDQVHASYNCQHKARILEFQLATLPRSILSFEEQMAAFEEVMRADRHRAEEASAERWLDRDSMRGR